MVKEKGNYVDGFVLVVYKNKLATYKKMAQFASKVWLKYGALDYKECVADDMYPKWGLPFPKLTKTKPNEVVVFAYIVYKSRKHRDAVNAKVMKDPMMNDPKHMNKPMPFDMKRMAYGGFKVLVG
jgi:alkaline phosphatase